MDKHADIIFKDDRFLVTGKLNCFNVMGVYKKSLPYLDNAPAFEFDFSAVKSSDSAGLALIIEWIKYAKIQKKRARFHHLSLHILALAKAAGLDTLL